MKLDVKLIKQTDTQNCNEVLKIYTNSFPENERIDFENFFKNNRELYGYFDNDELVGFISCKKNDLYSFICYFAVEKSKRSMGYGSAILEIFKNSNKDKCIVLNIENIYNGCSQNHIRLKRLNFYIKNGFNRSELIFDWCGDILNTLYIGTFNTKTYINFLLQLFPNCINFRQLDNSTVLIDIKKLNIDKFYKLHKQDFPFDERRSKEKYKQLLNNLNFKNTYIFLENKLIGYINFWDFNDFIFIEHFAIFKELRDKGYGTKFLNSFLQNTSKDIIFEIEPVTDEITTRRANFYLRLGFKFSDVEYYQPSYHKKGTLGPKLNIMYKTKTGTKKLNGYLQTLKEKVYNIN